jgi:membrane fusion protein, multidrug efflux system
VVGSDNKIQLRPINIGRDYGATLEILGGVAPNERIVINPADSLDDGQTVNVAQMQPNQQSGQGAQSGSQQGSQPGQPPPGQQQGSAQKGNEK